MSFVSIEDCRRVPAEGATGMTKPQSAVLGAFRPQRHQNNGVARFGSDLCCASLRRVDVTWAEGLRRDGAGEVDSLGDGDLSRAEAHKAPVGAQENSPGREPRGTISKNGRQPRRGERSQGAPLAHCLFQAPFVKIDEVEVGADILARRAASFLQEMRKSRFLFRGVGMT
jgi:hypothetical protein